MFKPFHRRQEALLPPSLEELIPPGDLVYTVSEVVELLNLQALYRSFSRLGQNAYHPKMLLAVLFYAYTQGVFASRQIAERLCYDVRYMYLAGGQRPDFRTLSDFRKNHRGLLKDYFRQLLKLCRQAGLLPLRRIAIDGSKLGASASRQRSLDRQELAGRLQATEAEIEALLQAAEAADAAEPAGPDPQPGATLPSLQELRRRLRQAQQELEAHPELERVNVTDPECRGQKGVGPGYNAQIAVDADSGLIVGTQVVTAANDTQQLLPMIWEVESSSDSAAQPKTVLADSGYAAVQAWEQLQSLPHVEAYVPTREQVQQQRGGEPGPFHHSRFQYDLATRTATCPQGQPLRFLRQGINKSGRAYVNFLGTACPQCPVQGQCTKARYRHLVVQRAHALQAQMEARMDSAAGHQAMRTRMATVEPVWGILKEQRGFRRFHLRGREKVQAEFALLCTAFNLKKLHRLLGGRSLGAALALAVRPGAAAWTGWYSQLREIANFRRCARHNRWIPYPAAVLP